MIHYIYIASIVLLTIFAIVYYMIQKNNFNEEIRRIEMIELQEKKKEEELENLRSKTQPCPHGKFDDPRSCYIGSNYKCSWNETTKRCE